MSVNSASNIKYVYHYNEGILCRSNLEKNKFEVRNFKTCAWNPTSDTQLIGKMRQGKGIVPQQDAENLFLKLKKRMEDTAKNSSILFKVT